MTRAPGNDAPYHSSQDDDIPEALRIRWVAVWKPRAWKLSTHTSQIATAPSVDGWNKMYLTVSAKLSRVINPPIPHPLMR